MTTAGDTSGGDRSDADGDRPLSVGMLVDRFPVLSQTFVLNQIVGLIERGHEVTVYPMGGVMEGKRHALVERYDLMNRVARVAKNRRDNTNAGFMSSTGQFYRQARHDLFHCQFGMLGLTALRFKQHGFFVGPVVTHFRGFDTSSYVQKHGPNVYDQLFREGAHFITNSDHFHARLLELGCDPARLSINRSGIDLERFPFTPPEPPQPPEPPEPPEPPPDPPERSDPGGRAGAVRLTTVARLTEKKGVAYGVRAAAMLIEQGVDVTYRIAGDGELRGELEALVEQLGVGHAVTLLGAVDQAEVAALLRETDIFLAPSILARSGDEDGPVNTLKEAMALGVPSIGTRVGGLPELIDDGVSGLLCAPADAADLVNAVRRMLDLRPSWPNIARAARQHIESLYDIERLNDELVGIYRKVVRETRGG